MFMFMLFMFMFMLLNYKHNLLALRLLPSAPLFSAKLLNYK